MNCNDPKMFAYLASFFETEDDKLVNLLDKVWTDEDTAIIEKELGSASQGVMTKIYYTALEGQNERVLKMCKKVSEDYLTRNVTLQKKGSYRLQNGNFYFEGFNIFHLIHILENNKDSPITVYIINPTISDIRIRTGNMNIIMENENPHFIHLDIDIHVSSFQVYGDFILTGKVTFFPNSTYVYNGSDYNQISIELQGKENIRTLRIHSLRNFELKLGEYRNCINFDLEGCEYILGSYPVTITADRLPSFLQNSEKVSMVLRRAKVSSLEGLNFKKLFMEECLIGNSSKDEQTCKDLSFVDMSISLNYLKGCENLYLERCTFGGDNVKMSELTQGIKEIVLYRNYFTVILDSLVPAECKARFIDQKITG